MKYYQALNFGDEAECIFNKNELIIRPISRGVGSEFAEQILEELLLEGFSGDELLKEFRARQAQIRPAVENMMSDAKKAANGETEFSTYADVFEKEN